MPFLIQRDARSPLQRSPDPKAWIGARLGPYQRALFMPELRLVERFSTLFCFVIRIPVRCSPPSATGCAFGLNRSLPVD